MIQQPGGQPIRKASVVLRSAAGAQPSEYTASTDVESRFKLDDVKPGRYFFTVERSGFVPSATGTRATSIVLASGHDASELVIYMQPAAVITGKIVDLDGDPMPNVSISVSRAGSLSPGFRAHESGGAASDDRGEFRVPDLRAGRYTVVASPPQGVLAPRREENGKAKPNIVYAATYYPGTLDQEQAVAVELHPGDEANINFGILASPVYRVTGVASGVPKDVLFAEIALSSKNQGMEQMQQLGADGKFEFRNLLPGTYKANVVLARSSSNVLTPAMQMMLVPEPIQVNNADLDGLRLQIVPPQVIRGRVRMDPGQSFDWTQLEVLLLPIGERDSGVALGVGLAGRRCPG